MISSPDPQQKRASDEDPIFIEYNRGDRHKWNCRDSNGEEFVFELGKRDTAYGLKWDAKAKREDGTWDMDVVRKTAHYVTPSGAVITEADRMDIVRGGRWIATNPDAPANVRSYHITAFMTPFDSLGGIAVAFLKANAAGSSSLRTFVYEYLAEPWVQDTERIYDDQVTRRAAEYMRGQSYLDLHTEYSQLQKARMLTVDVQKDHMWYVCRDWAAGGKSALVEWGFAGTWEDIDAVALRNKVEAVLVDSGYGERTTEVYEECIRRRMVPCKGDDRNTPTELAWRQSQINPFEGTRRTGYSETLALILWRTDIFKQMLLSRIRGDVSGWWVYRGIERDYCQQITAEERTAKGWVKRRRDNHILDCEAMQILAALAYGYLSKYDVPGIDIPPEDPPAE